MIDPTKNFTHDCWIVSVVNTKSASAAQTFGGHALMVVEGLKKTPGLAAEAYIVRCDILAEITEKAVLNSKGHICEVRLEEGKDIHTLSRYSDNQSQSFYALPDDVEKMLLSVKEDKARTEDAAKGNCEYIPYQTLGKSSILTSDDEGLSCASYVAEKLELLGIDVNDKKPGKTAGKPCAVM